MEKIPVEQLKQKKHETPPVSPFAETALGDMATLKKSEEELEAEEKKYAARKAEALRKQIEANAPDTGKSLEEMEERFNQAERRYYETEAEENVSHPMIKKTVKSSFESPEEMKRREEDFLDELATDLSDITKQPIMKNKEIQKIFSADTGLANKIKIILNKYIQNEGMKEMALGFREEIYKKIMKELGKARLEEEMAAFRKTGGRGELATDGLRKIYQKYKDEEVELLEYFNLGKENEKTGEIKYAKGVSIRIED